MRVVLCYEKLGPAAFIAHLDFQQLWWRIFRLAGVKLQHSQGYNPRPKIRFAVPLATGFQGERELMEAFTEGDSENILPALNSYMPGGMKVVATTVVPADYPKITALVDALAYKVSLPSRRNIEDSVAAEAGDYLLKAKQEGEELSLLLKVINQKTLRPDTLVTSCLPEVCPADLAITRTGIFAYEAGPLVPVPSGLFLLPR